MTYEVVSASSSFPLAYQTLCTAVIAMSSVSCLANDEIEPSSTPLHTLTAMDYFDFGSLMPVEYVDPPNDMLNVPQSIDQETSTPIGSPAWESNRQIVISVSTTFSTLAFPEDEAPDVIFTSSDHVYFHVHAARLLMASRNSFNHLLPIPHLRSETQALAVAEDAAVINVVFHAIYKISLRQYSPPLDTLLAAVGALKKYGVPLDQYLFRTTPLFEEVVIKTPYLPIEVYMVAAENDLFDLAAEASLFLLSYPLSILTNKMCVRMGPLYLRRLFTLHTERKHVLQQLLINPPSEHPPTLSCGWVEHKRLMNAWSLACASLVFDAQTDLSAEKMRNDLESLGLRISCDACKRSLNQRVKDIVLKWSIAPRTILRDTGGYRAVLQ
ncbi:unnamed protein product [Somion occarium]|uniref:BTB domain-containing protein n=1 Tax=Somion occarium TaxID=3059160 RepID=A0ABP1E4A2_9APHY